MDKSVVKKSMGKIGIGPLSEEIIEAVFRFSEKENEPLMLIATQNQIDWDGGYVNQWKTRDYTKYLNVMRKKYPNATVYICRDHCGPGFKTKGLESTYRTIDEDIANGFDLIHVDLCHYSNNHKKVLEESRKVIDYVYKKNPKVRIEIGTDENTGKFLTDIKKIEEDIKFFHSFPNILFYVCQTGSLVKETNQVGGFNKKFIKEVKSLVNRYELKLKEHNADYLNRKEIRARHGIIDAVNIAPQFGVIQTKLMLKKASKYGVNTKSFLEDSYKSRRWEKWLHKGGTSDKLLCSIIAGHYNFSAPSYKKIYLGINKFEDFRESIISALMNSIKLYADNL